MFLAYLQVLLVSFLPLIELRGAIPWGIVKLDLHWGPVLALAIVSNILIVPFIWLFLKFGQKLLVKIKIGKRFWDWLVSRVQKKFSGKYYSAGVVGLLLFVAIPLPGTGVWTGTLAGYLFGFRKRDVFKSMLGGVVIAGIIVTILTLGAVEIF
jgi:uncharacterized membrane protein